MTNTDIELIEKGIQYMRAAEYDKAEQLFDDAIELQGANLARAYYNKGVLFHMHFNKKRESILYYENAISLNPNYGKSWYNLGDIYTEFNQYEKAKIMFQNAAKEMPEEIKPLISIAHVLNRMNDFSSAIYILKSLLEIEKLDDELLAKINSELGLALLQTSQVIMAYEHFKEAFLLNENDYQACYNIAYIADAFKRYDEAILFYGKAIILDVNEAKAYQGKACTYIHQKKYEKGLSLIEKAIELAPGNFEGYYNLASIYAGLNKEQELFNAIQKTIDLAPVQIGIATHIQNDPDFSFYTKHPNFLSLLK